MTSARKVTFNDDPKLKYLTNTDAQMLTVIRISKVYPQVKKLYNETVYKDQKENIFNRILKIDTQVATTFVNKEMNDFEGELINLIDEATINEICELFEELANTYTQQ